MAEGHIGGNVNAGGLTVPLGEAAPVGKVGGGEGQGGREEDENGEKEDNEESWDEKSNIFSFSLARYWGGVLIHIKRNIF